MKKTFLIATALLMYFAATDATLAQNANQATEIGAFGMVSIASGQTARLNIYWPSARQMPPGPPSRVQLSLMGINGNLAVQSDCQNQIDCLSGSQTSIMLSPGQSAFLEVSGDQIIGALSRAEIHPVVNVYTPPGPPTCPANTIISTFEVIDNATNKTVLFYHPPGPCRVGLGNN